MNEELVLSKVNEIMNKERSLFGFEWNNRRDETIFLCLYLIMMANARGTIKVSEELVTKVLQYRDFDDEDDEEFFKNRKELYERVLISKSVRADWKHGITPNDSLEAILYIYGDLMSDDSYYKDYENCPVYGMDIAERTEFIKKLEEGIFPLVIDLMKLIR